MLISGGSFSRIYIIMAKTPDKKVSAFIVPRDAKVFLLIKNNKKWDVLSNLQL
jgi:alkylation response protein AidB-like acyl-CoA dehydrogenase